LDAPVRQIALDPPELALAEALPAPPAAAGRELTGRPLPWLDAFGRILVVWIPLFGLCTAALASSERALGVSLAFALVWALALRRAYSGVAVTTWTMGTTVPALAGTIGGALVLLPFVYAVPGLHLAAATFAELTLAVFLAALMWESCVGCGLVPKRRVLVVGAEDGGTELVEDLALAPRLPFELVGLVDDDRGGWVAGAPCRGGVADLAEIVERQRPQLIVLADEKRRAAALERLVDVSDHDFAVVGVPEFYEYAFGRLPVRTLTAQWFMSVLHLYRRPYPRRTKRAFDVVVATIALVLVAPLLPLLALLVRLTPGPAILRQTRLGECGRPFTLYKFRTMRVDAEPAGPVWCAERDPRVTHVGRLLRKTRLDELPQLWNVLRGDMSMVGPRPERPEFVASLQRRTPFWSRRHLVKPGITGWAQVCRGYTSDHAGTRDKLSYDLWYLRHRSLLVDLAICARTLWVVLRCSGAR
jgi:exopolysaccharide biosynthesis polyprenyl glycosylphosphotransferase